MTSTGRPNIDIERDGAPEMGPIWQTGYELIIQILQKMFAVFILFLITWSGQEFAHVTTALPSRHEQISDLTWSDWYF